MDLSPNRAKKKIASEEAAIFATRTLRWTFLADLIWLSGSLLLDPSKITEEAQALAAIGAGILIFSSKYLLASDEAWSQRLPRLRQFLNSNYGRILSGLFAAGVTLEVLSYVAQISALTIPARLALALIVGGIIAARFNPNGLAGRDAHREKPPFSPVLMATIAVRIAAVLTSVIGAGPLRYLAWGVCVLNIPPLVANNRINKSRDLLKPPQV